MNDQVFVAHFYCMNLYREKVMLKCLVIIKVSQPQLPISVGSVGVASLHSSVR